jgi:predicted dehydrogenase
MSRKRGRLVLVGVTGLNLSRDDFYAKELTFAVSCSYGPGRYDPNYEEDGNDYPLGFVRWTEQRNFDAVLQLMSSGALDPRPLITHRFDFDAAPEAYDLLTSNAPSLGIILEYSDRGARAPQPADRIRYLSTASSRGGAFTVGVIGAGNFANRVLIPAIVGAGGRLRSIASSKGASAAVVARKHGFEVAATDVDAILTDSSVDTIIVATRHDSHAKLALRALSAGKHVFVEKPLALTMADLEMLEEAVASSVCVLTVGFNRRFAPLARRVREQLKGRAGPASLILTVNAGRIPREHWVHHSVTGGGRIAGEGCHFIDLARYLVGSPIVAGSVTAARGRDGQPIDDVAHLSLSFADGSTAVVHYLANGSPAFPKERVEVFADGRVFQIDNWRRLHAWGGTSEGSMFSKANKGHAEELTAFGSAVRDGGGPPIPYEELFDVSRWTIRLAQQARQLSPS